MHAYMVAPGHLDGGHLEVGWLSDHESVPQAGKGSDWH